MIAALRTTVEFFEAEPVLARFCLVAPFTAPAEEVTAHCNERIAAAVPYLAEGRRAGEGEELPRGTENSLLGGVVSQLSRSVLAQTPLTALLPDLIEFVLGPYLGAEPARRLVAEATA